MALSVQKAITSSGEPPSGRYLLKMFIVCLSYVNLCFLNVWTEMNNRAFDAFRIYGETWQKLAAVTLDILILAAILWAAICLALGTGKSAWIRFVKWAAIIGLLLPANIIRLDDTLFSNEPVSMPHGSGWRLVILLALAAGGIVLVCRRRWNQGAGIFGKAATVQQRGKISGKVSHPRRTARPVGRRMVIPLECRAFCRRWLPGDHDQSARLDGIWSGVRRWRK